MAGGTSQGEPTGSDTGFTTNVGFPNPGSPGEGMGMPAPAPSGGVGAADPGGGQDVTGDTQEHERGIVDEGAVPLEEALKPRMVEDTDPQHSNISGPTPVEGAGSG